MSPPSGGGEVYFDDFPTGTTFGSGDEDGTEGDKQSLVKEDEENETAHHHDMEKDGAATAPTTSADDDSELFAMLGEDADDEEDFGEMDEAEIALLGDLDEDVDVEALLDQMEAKDDLLMKEAEEEEEEEEEEEKEEDLYHPDDIAEVDVIIATLREEMLQDVQERRRQNPMAVPKTAEGFVETVLEERRLDELEERREARVKRELRQREDDLRAERLAKVVTPEDVKNDPVVQQILQEASVMEEEEKQVEEDLQAVRDYEEELRRQREDQIENDANWTAAAQAVVDNVSSFQDFDSQVLETLQQLYDKQVQKDQERLEGQPESKLAQQLRERIELLSQDMSRPSSQVIFKEGDERRPRDDAEWQAYFAITSKMKREQNVTQVSELNPDDVAAKLQSWREYRAAEQAMRIEAGLSEPPDAVKMPFPWMEKKKEQPQVTSSTTRVKLTARQRQEAQIEADELALNVLQQLRDKTADASRRSKLEQEVQELRAAIAQRRKRLAKMPKEEAKKEEEALGGPVDLSEVFEELIAEFRSDDDDKLPPPRSVSRTKEERTRRQEEEDERRRAWEERQAAAAAVGLGKGDDEDEGDEGEYVDRSEISLGTAEEQEFQNVLRRSGVTTQEEEDELRAKWEAYREAERKMRERYDISRKREEEEGRPSFNAMDIAEEQFLATGMAGQLKNDPEALAKAKKEYTEVLQQESEMRQKWEEENEKMKKEKDEQETATAAAPKLEEEVDLDKYADDVLAKLGPRPKLKSKAPDKKQEKKGEEKASDESTARRRGRGGFKDGLEDKVPAWLKREQESGRPEEFNIESAEGGGKEQKEADALVADNGNDDYNLDDDDGDYESSGSKRSSSSRKGIDVFTSVARDMFGDDDDRYYDDDDALLGGGRGHRGWSTTGDPELEFQSTKATLLEFTELSLEEVNACFDILQQQEALVNPYRPKIQKPFSEFGAILRLEGFLVDVEPLQTLAWKRTAERFGLKEPDEDRLRRAAVHGPEMAIHQVLIWSNDLSVQRDLARAHAEEVRNLLAAEYPELVSEVGEAEAEAGSLFLGDNDDQHHHHAHQASASSSLGNLEVPLIAWTAAAEAHGFISPDLEAVKLASKRDAEFAIGQVFRWTSDEAEIQKVATTYRKALEKLSPQDSIATSDDKANNPLEEVQISKTQLLDMKIVAWKQVAQEFKLSPPTPEQMSLAPVFDKPADMVKTAFRWTTSDDECNKYVKKFESLLETMLAEYKEKNPPPPKPPLFRLHPGVPEWLDKLQKWQMPVAILSRFEADLMRLVLRTTGLDAWILPEFCVSAALYKEDAQEMLGASLRLQRRPNHCIVFDSTPAAAAAAHEVEMKSVAKIRPYAKYELLTADMAERYYDEMRADSLRRLFGNDETEPETAAGQAGPPPKGRGRWDRI